MVDIFLFLAIIFLLTFIIGKLLEKIRVPWIFGALIVGSLLAIYNPFSSATSSPTFGFLAQLGMYFLLFIIGFEINLKKFEKRSKFILKSTFFIIFLEGILGTIMIYYLFHYSLLISFIVAASFATVGEAILIPILDKFKIVNTKLGQSIIGIGTFDDIVEISLLILVSILIGTNFSSLPNLVITSISLLVLIILTVGLVKSKKQEKRFKFSSEEILLFFILSGLFLFLGIGKFADAMPISALLAGIGLKTFITKDKTNKTTEIIKSICYGFFAPIFFVWVGISLSMGYLVTAPLLILLVIVVSGSAKLLGSWIIGKRELGTKKSILLGIGLSVRFSTSIIIIKILFENNLIKEELYSIIVASSIIFTFIIPILFSNLLDKWEMGKKRN